MPKSKRPRKPHRRVDVQAGWSAAQKLCNYLIRGYGGWSDSDRNEFAGHFLEPVTALRYSDPKDDLRPLFALAKAQMVLAWCLTSWYVTEDREYERDEIAAANQALQVAFNVWLDHRRMLYPQLKAARVLMQERFENLTTYFEPYEISSQRYTLAHGAGFYDRAEAELDGRLRFKRN